MVADDEGARVVGSFGEVVAGGYDLVAVDMPIGLPTSGARACD
ncbi:MAG: hypothetical protein JWN67_4884, partial [Actinomycetia bacterium]|nr:hypothetical protein [Actinomycetes bacterium]